MLVHCSTCAKKFSAKPAIVLRNRRNFCSLACYETNRARPIVERFWEKVEKTASCWLWKGNIRGNGRVPYGTLSTTRGGPSLSAHRFAWTLMRGPIPNGMLVLHKCDVSLCVNVRHLFLGTAADNTADMIKKEGTEAADQRAHATLLIAIGNSQKPRD